MIRAILACLVVLWGVMVPAQEFSGLARVDMAGSKLSDARQGVRLVLVLSQGVPYRIFTLDAPERLVLDFREVDWRGVDPKLLDWAEGVTAVRVGGFRPGWSRMVVDLAGPLAVESADMALDDESGAARLEVALTRVSAADFAATAGAPEAAGWDPGMARVVTSSRQTGEAPLRVVIDPGHGGIDPGAEQEGAVEKELMLSFARELREALVRAGGFEVVLTRNEDVFVSLEERVAMAHRHEADVFLSLHADALTEGRAHGATVYTLSDSASDAASAALAERHDRADILAGIDLSGTDDEVADVLMDLARMETQPRADQLARAIRLGIGEQDLPLNSRPLRAAGFSVLKSPDIPSVLLELGFLSSDRDRGHITDADWRARMARAVVDALIAWRIADAAAAELVRQ